MGGLFCLLLEQKESLSVCMSVWVLVSAVDNKRRVPCTPSPTQTRLSVCLSVCKIRTDEICLPDLFVIQTQTQTQT